MGALVFFYRHVLSVDLPWLDELVRAKRPAHVPVALTREEVAAVLSHLSGAGWLMVAIRSGPRLRLLECLTLRVKDVDFGRVEVVVRRGKGGRDRRTVLPAAGRQPPAVHFDQVRAPIWPQLGGDAARPIARRVLLMRIEYLRENKHVPQVDSGVPTRDRPQGSRDERD
jgi:integrase